MKASLLPPRFVSKLQKKRKLVTNFDSKCSTVGKSCPIVEVSIIRAKDVCLTPFRSLQDNEIVRIP